VKTYTIGQPGAPVPGTNLSVVVGGGAGNGGPGSVSLTWS
jgi:hypothetical protein